MAINKGNGWLKRGWVDKKGEWVTKKGVGWLILVARLLITARSLGSNPDIPQKSSILACQQKILKI